MTNLRGSEAMNVGPRQIAWSLCSSRVCLGKGHLTRGGSTPHVHLWSALSRSFSVLISTNHWGTTNRNSIHPKYCPTLYPKSRQLVRTAGCRVKFVSLCSRTYTVNSRLEPSESDSPDFVSVESEMAICNGWPFATLFANPTTSTPTNSPCRAN